MTSMPTLIDAIRHFNFFSLFNGIAVIHLPVAITRTNTLVFKKKQKTINIIEINVAGKTIKKRKKFINH